MLISPKALAVNPVTHKMYAVDQTKDLVDVVDGSSATVRVIKVGKSPNAIAIDSGTNKIFVLNTASNTVSVIDGVRDMVVSTIAAGRIPYAIAIDTSLHKVFVANTYSNFITSFDEASNQTTPLPLGSKDALLVDPDRHELFLLSYESSTLQAFSVETGNVRQIPATMHLWALASDSRRELIYATEAQDKALLRIDERSGAEMTIATGAMPCAAGVDERTGFVYVANCVDNNVTVIDGASGKWVATVQVGAGPQAIAVDSIRGLVAVANTHSNTVSFINEQTNSVVSTVPGGRNPYALAIDAENGNVYAANFGPRCFTKLDVRSLLRSNGVSPLPGASSETNSPSSPRVVNLITTSTLSHRTST
ncbi:YncE family protein [Acidipila sp. EB88]|uniref:YncE family protein n=1 Tax=Acidipila sp. EB88 TaxID=2305226 RepID=UPI0013156DE9|nr:hypothetical protein [Acidipila sp. EB88]